MDCSPPGSSVHGISQARILEWVAISFSRRSSWSRDQTHISCIGQQILYHWVTREVLAAAKLLQSCPTLCDPIEGNPPGSAVPGILQARTLEWVAIPFSRESSWPCRDRTCISLCLLHWQAGFFLPLMVPGKPKYSVNAIWIVASVEIQDLLFGNLCNFFFLLF